MKRVLVVGAVSGVALTGLLAAALIIGDRLIDQALAVAWGDDDE